MPRQPIDQSAHSDWLKRRRFVAVLITANVSGMTLANLLAEAGSTKAVWVALGSCGIVVAAGLAERIFPPTDQERQEERLPPIGRFIGGGLLGAIVTAGFGAFFTAQAGRWLLPLLLCEVLAFLGAWLIDRRSHRLTPAEIRSRLTWEERLGMVVGLAIAAWLLVFVFGLVGYIAVWIEPGSPAANWLRYSWEVGVSYSDIHIDEKPHDCEFISAPIGAKNCHYAPVVRLVRVSRTDSGDVTVSNDGGRSWSSMGTSDGTLRPSVHVSWQRVVD